MYCKNCGQKIESASQFCRFCGIEVVSDNVGKEEKNDNKESVWDVFAQIHDAADEEREKYNNLSSDVTWELINRLGKNSFESFIEENKEQLNKQPYKVLENLESVFRYAVIGGYWLWMAERINKKGDVWQLNAIILDEIINEWDDNIKNVKKIIGNLSKELDEAIGIYQNFKMKSFLENSPSAKELTSEFIDDIKAQILLKIVWGYVLGISEAKYIK